MNYFLIFFLLHCCCKASIDQLKSDYYCSQHMINQTHQLMHDRLSDHATDALWLYNTAQCYYENKDYQKAYFYFTQAAAYDENNKKKIALPALYQAGNSAVHTKNLQQALTHFESVIGYDPDHQQAKRMIEVLKKALDNQSNDNQKKENNKNDSDSKEGEPESNPPSNQQGDTHDNDSTEQHTTSSKQSSCEESDNKSCDNTTTPSAMSKENESENTPHQPADGDPNHTACQKSAKRCEESKQSKKLDNQQKETSYTSQEASELQEQLAAHHDASISKDISKQQLHLLKQVEQADKNAQKAMLHRAQSTSNKRNAYETQW